MLALTLIALVLAIPLTSKSEKSFSGTAREISFKTISATLLTRIVSIALIFAAFLSFNCFLSLDYQDGSALETLDAGVGLYSGLIHATTVTQSMEVFLLFSASIILLSSRPASQLVGVSTISEYPLIILFTTLGGTFLLASADLVSLYLSIELQSFGVYILAALSSKVSDSSESAVSAGLKYFLLGALSSAVILLGSALVYANTGLTNLDSIFEYLSVPGLESEQIYQLNTDTLVILGFVFISVGLLFKIASAPFHYWAPDVYDGTPTIVSNWLMVMPKISLLVFMLELSRGLNTAFFSPANIFGADTFSFVFKPLASLFLICAFLSLIIGVVVGLAQYRIKRLLAYSTISHVGFMLLALAGMQSIPALNVSEELSGDVGLESVEAFLFYIIQYSLTNINTFFVLLAFGYQIFLKNKDSVSGSQSDIAYTSELQGQFQLNPILGLSLAICLFSMAGVPPIVGFFAKYTVLYSAIHNGYFYLAIVAILASVVSAVYYLRVVRVIYFSEPAPSIALSGQNETIGITSVHSYIIACLSLFILLFALNPTLLLNSTSIMALSLFVT